MYMFGKQLWKKKNQEKNVFYAKKFEHLQKYSSLSEENNFPSWSPSKDLAGECSPEHLNSQHSRGKHEGGK